MLIVPSLETPSIWKLLGIKTAKTHISVEQMTLAHFCVNCRASSDVLSCTIPRMNENPTRKITSMGKRILPSTAAKPGRQCLLRTNKLNPSYLGLAHPAPTVGCRDEVGASLTASSAREMAATEERTKTAKCLPDFDGHQVLDVPLCCNLLMGDHSAEAQSRCGPDAFKEFGDPPRRFRFHASGWQATTSQNGHLQMARSIE